MPHVAIADTGSAAASLLNGLNAAANQQTARDATKKAQDAADYQRGLQQDLTNALDLQKNNYVPATTRSSDASGVPPGRPTLALPQDNPAAQGDGPTITDRNGQVWKQKSKDQLASEDPRNFVPTGQLASMLKSGGRDVTKPISPTDAHDILQSLNLAQPKDEDYEIDASGKFQGADGKPAAAMIGKKTGRVRLLDFGGKDLGDPGASGQFAPPDKTPPAAKSLRFEPSTNDRGDVTMRGFDPETGALVSTNVAKGIGGTRKDPNAAPAEKPPSPAQLRLVVSDRAKALKAAKDAYAKAAAPIGGADGVPVSDQDMAEAAVTLRKAHVQAQNDYEEGISALTGKEVPHNDWADKALADAQTQAVKKTRAVNKATAKSAPAQRTAAPAEQRTAASAQAITEGTIISDGKGNRQVLKAGKWTPIK